MADTVLAALRKVNRWVAVLIGVMLMACVIFVLLEIVIRQLGSSLGGTDEISGYVMAIATSWGMAFAMLELGHVRIDILRSRVGDLGRSLFDLFSMIVLTGTITLIAYQCWPVVETSIANSSRANTSLETPLWIVQVPWFAGWVWFAAMACMTSIAALILIAQGRFAASETAIGAFAEQESSV